MIEEVIFLKYYCLGIKGAGMSTLACILYDLGYEVVGYDSAKEKKFTEEGLDKRGIKVYTDSNHELDKDMIVTHSVALPHNQEELVRVREFGLEIKKYNEILGDITKMFNSICVSGTHGKTTTSAMISHLLKEKGINYFIGDGSGYVSKDNKNFVIEADEFNRHFLAYHPEYAIITNIELEHMEIYKDLDDILNTFEAFANKTKKEVIACGDNENIRKIKYKVPVKYYGVNDNNDIVAKNLKLTSDGSEFDYYVDGKFITHFELPLYGKHMVLNALSVIYIVHKKGLSYDEIRDRLHSFHNAKRRFAIEEVKSNIIIDDYAHHPTEIKATLEAVRQKYPNKKVIAVFKPNTYSRTRDFYQEFADSLNVADKTYLTEIESNREKSEDYGNVTSKKIFDLLTNAEMIDDDSTDKLTKYKDSVICFMSCASIQHMIDNYKKSVQ